MLLVSLFLLALVQGAEALTVTEAPSNTSAVIGGNATLTCSVTNKQNSENVKWHLTGNSNPLTLNALPVNNDGHYLIMGTYNLLIVNLTLSDDAQYTCEAAGTEYYGHLTVVDLPANLSVYWAEGRPVEGPSNNMTCFATRGHPPPSLSWYKNGLALDSSRAVYTGTADEAGYGEAVSILPVSVTSEDDGAVYECQASYPQLPDALSANLTLTFNAVTGQASCQSCRSSCEKASSMGELWKQKLIPHVAYWFYSNCGVQPCPDFGAFAAVVADLLKTELCHA